MVPDEGSFEKDVYDQCGLAYQPRDRQGDRHLSHDVRGGGAVGPLLDASEAAAFGLRRRVRQSMVLDLQPKDRFKSCYLTAR